jgi:hypothetical protein
MFVYQVLVDQDLDEDDSVLSLYQYAILLISPT